MDQAEQIINKTRELYTLQGRLHRYWKKLVKVSIGVAQEMGIKSRFVEFWDIVTDDQEIHIPIDGDNVDTSELLKLAKEREPSLYRRYQQGQQRYELGCKELEAMVN